MTVGKPDKYYGMDTLLSDPSNEAKAVVPHATNALDPAPKALYVGTGGDITMRGGDDTVDTVWKNVPSGTILPFRPKFVRAAGTTAADILALY